MALQHVPDLLKHMTLAIMENTGRTDAGFLKAFQIARDKLVRDGYLTSASSKGPSTDKIRLTPKGDRQNRKHAREGKGKSKLFDLYFRRTELDEAEGKKDAKSEKIAGEEK
jgi:hypothetical protein